METILGNKSSGSSFQMNPSGSSGNSTKEFFESNSLVAKFAFLIMIVFIFVLLLRLGINFLAWLFSPSKSQTLVRGTINANQSINIPQDPSSNGAITLYRSDNQNDGIEFTWSVWIYVEDLKPLGKFKHIFYKGNDYLLQNGMNYPNNAPGLYLAPDTNSLIVIMNTFNVINEEITIPDIPMNKWLNVIIRCKNTTLDVYINGTITRSVQLHGVPKQNYGDVNVAMNGGFDGYIADLKYYAYALGTTEIAELASKGPNTFISSSTNLNNKASDYLSIRWYLFGSNNMYNP